MHLRTWALLGALLVSSTSAQTTPAALADALQAAARAGDAAGYRALLRPWGTFAVEGSNFAADLARVPQKDVRYGLSDLKVDGAAARARLELNWTRGGVPSRAAFPVRLEQEGGVWKYRGEDLAPLTAPGFSLFAMNDGALPGRAAVLAPLLPRAAARVREALGLEVPAGASVKVYPSMESLSASVALSLQPVGGWNEPGEAIKMILPSGDRAEADALRLLSHEFTHLSVAAAVGEGAGATDADKRVPWWLHEGLADYSARAYWSPEAVRARQERITGYAKNDWVPLSELVNFTAVPEARWRYVYAQGLGVVDFLAAQKGNGGPMALARAFANEGSADGAARALGYADFKALEAAARAWLSAR